MKPDRLRTRAIPALTWISALFGGLILAYLGMILVVALTPAAAAEKLIVPMILLPVVWCGAGVWIFHSPSGRHALLKTVMAVAILAVPALVLYLRR